MDGKNKLSDYFILRLPQAEAEKIKYRLRLRPKKIKKWLQIEFDDEMETGKVYIKNRCYEGKLVKLPTIIDVNKSTNNINLYKIGAITQMLIVGDEEALKKVKNDTWAHGISRPLKNVQKQRFRKTMRNEEDVKEAADIQKELNLLLRADYEAVSSRYQIVYEDPEDMPPLSTITVESLFGSFTDSESDETTESAPPYDIIEFN